MLETILLFADGFPDSSPNWVAAFVECFKCADSGPGFFAWNKCDTFPSFLHNSTVRFQIINCVSSTHATTNHVPLLFSTNILCFCPLCFRKTIFYALVICTLNTVTFPANEKYLPFWVPSEINRQRFSPARKLISQSELFQLPANDYTLRDHCSTTKWRVQAMLTQGQNGAKKNVSGLQSPLGIQNPISRQPLWAECTRE